MHLSIKRLSIFLFVFKNLTFCLRNVCFLCMFCFQKQILYLPDGAIIRFLLHSGTRRSCCPYHCRARWLGWSNVKLLLWQLCSTQTGTIIKAYSTFALIEYLFTLLSTFIIDFELFLSLLILCFKTVHCATSFTWPKSFNILYSV
jgi:hypothetical protein